MAVARRVYLYGIALVALGMLANGLSGLLETGLRLLVERLGPPLAAVGESELRGAVSSAGALILIGLAAWLVHWGLAGRAVRRAEGGPAERASAIRKLYLYAALLIGGVWLTLALEALVADGWALAIGRLGRGEVVAGRLVGPAAALAAVGVLWAYHVRAAARDRAVQPEAGAGATLRRWCVYGLAGLGLLLLLFGAKNLLSTVWDALFPAAGGAVLADNWLPAALGPEVAGVAAGLVVWTLAWTWSGGWLRRAGDADPESASTLRKVYLYLILALAVAWTVWNAGRILYDVLRGLLLGERLAGGWGGVLNDLGGSLAAVAVFGVAWLYHARAVNREAGLAPERRTQMAVRWCYEYLAALVGLVTLAIGLGGALSTLVDGLAQPNAVRPTNWWEDRISLFATLIAVGLPLWLVYWARLQREAPDPLVRASLVRRMYLLLVFALSVLTLLSSGAFALYQLIRLALGEGWTAGQTTDLIEAGSAAAVAALFLGYHLRVLRTDTRAPPTTRPAEPVVGVVVVRASGREAWEDFRRRVERQAGGELRLEARETDEATAASLIARPSPDA